MQFNKSTLIILIINVLVLIVTSFAASTVAPSAKVANHVQEALTALGLNPDILSTQQTNPDLLATLYTTQQQQQQQQQQVQQASATNNDNNGINILNTSDDEEEHNIDEDDSNYWNNGEDYDNFDFNQLLRAAQLSSVSRCLTYSTRSVKNWSCKTCRDRNKVPELVDVEVGKTDFSDVAWYIGYAPQTNEIIIVARSSIEIGNWIANFDFLSLEFPGCPKDYQDCKVHQGFYKAYLEARDDYLNIINKLYIKYLNITTQPPKISITGHSFGSAMAMHTTFDLFDGLFVQVDIKQTATRKAEKYWYNLQNIGYNKITPIQFEKDIIMIVTQNPTDGHSISLPIKYNVTPTYALSGPRVGSPSFAKWFMERLGTKQVYQIRRAGDPVPALPLRTMFNEKFQHPAREVYFPFSITDNKKYRICNDTIDEDLNCYRKTLVHGILTDHFVVAGVFMGQSPGDCWFY